MEPANNFFPGREPTAADYLFIDDESRHHQNRSVPANLIGIIYLGDGYLQLRIGRLEFILDCRHQPADSIAFGSTQAEDFDGEHADDPRS